MDTYELTKYFLEQLLDATLAEEDCDIEMLQLLVKIYDLHCERQVEQTSIN